MRWRRVTMAWLILLAGVCLIFLAELLMTTDVVTSREQGVSSRRMGGSHSITPERTQLCSKGNLASFDKGRACGAPLGAPCFDQSLCRRGNVGEGSPKVYVYDNECTLAASSQVRTTNRTNDRANHQYHDHQHEYWREAARKLGLLAETYEEACLFIHVETSSAPVPCATNAPLWNEGANHLIMQFSDLSRNMRPSVGNSYAMEGGSNQHTCYYRSGYDISVPLAPRKLFPEFEKIPAANRKYLLTFKGTLYLGGVGGEERTAAARIHDPTSGIVSVLRCFELHGEQLLPENVEYCSHAHKRFNSFDYERLMNTTFGLVPSGRSPGTYRLGEVMSAGAIPVFVMRDAILPLPEQIDWASFSFIFTPDDVGPAMIETLRRASESDRISEMQEKSVQAYWKLFGGLTDLSVVAENTVAELSRRLMVSL
ncbi:unnamed protein product [Scytosiphon promiscuus]